MQSYRSLRSKNIYSSNGYKITLIKKGYHASGDLTPIISTPEYNEAWLIRDLSNGFLTIKGSIYKVVSYTKMMNIESQYSKYGRCIDFDRCVYSVSLAREVVGVTNSDMIKLRLSENKSYGLSKIRVGSDFFLDGIRCHLIRKGLGLQQHHPVITVPWKDAYKLQCFFGREYIELYRVVYRLSDWRMLESKNASGNVIKKKEAVFCLSIDVPGVVVSDNSDFNLLDDIVFGHIS